jgi:hypothetical protein
MIPFLSRMKHFYMKFTLLFFSFMLLGMVTSSCVSSKLPVFTKIFSITATGTPKVSASSIPTFTSSKASSMPTQTSTPVLSPTETVLPATWMPLPTLSSGKAAAQLMKWFQGTPGCLFPCVGGIVPGKTTWDEAKQIMQPFTGIMGIGEDIPYKGIGGYITSDPKLSILMNADSTSIIKITVEGYPPSPVLRLDQILMEYGPPEKVFITVVPIFYYPENIPLFITLTYPSHQFVIQYGWTETMNIENVSACIQEGHIHLSILPKNEQWSDNFIKGEVFSSGDINSMQLKPIEEVTNMTIQEFYEQFKSIDGSECIVTPIHNWMTK